MTKRWMETNRLLIESLITNALKRHDDYYVSTTIDFVIHREFRL